MYFAVVVLVVAGNIGLYSDVVVAVDVEGIAE